MLNPAALIICTADIIFTGVVADLFSLVACEIWYYVEEIERKEDHGDDDPFKG